MGDLDHFTVSRAVGQLVTVVVSVVVVNPFGQPFLHRKRAQQHFGTYPPHTHLRKSKKCFIILIGVWIYGKRCH